MKLKKLLTKTGNLVLIEYLINNYPSVVYQTKKDGKTESVETDFLTFLIKNGNEKVKTKYVFTEHGKTAVGVIIEIE